MKYSDGNNGGIRKRILRSCRRDTPGPMVDVTIERDSQRTQTLKNVAFHIPYINRLAAVVAAGFLLVGCSGVAETRVRQDNETAPGAEVQEPVRVAREKFVRSLFVSGELYPVRSVRIMLPPLLGKGPFMIKSLVPEGTMVKPGELLIQVDNSTLVNSLEVEEINLERARNDLERKEAELEARLSEFEITMGRAKLELERASLKAEIPKDLIAVRDWQEYQFNYEKAKKEFGQTVDSLELAKKVAIEEVEQLRVREAQVSTRISRLRRDIAATEIRAVTAGTVLYEFWSSSSDQGRSVPRKVRVGDMAYWGQDILRIPDLNEMEVHAFVNEVDGGAVRVGQRARIVPDALPDLEYEGEISHVPEVAERSGRYSAVRIFATKIRLDRTDPAIMKPGMSARVEILLEEREGLVLPRHAVLREEGKFYVRLVTGEKREIKVIGRNATHFLIEGLAEGTEVQP